MSIVGHVESLWRYPVKSMGGEELKEAYLGVSGVYGDRLYAFHSAAAPKTFPYLTGREQEKMLLYRPVYQHSDDTASAHIASENSSDFRVDIETPEGEKLTIDDSRLINLLREGLRNSPELTLVCSDRAMTDCHPISLFSMQTVRQLSHELETGLDKRRFRANIYVDLASPDGFGEDQFVGRKLRIGSTVVIEVIERDPRCKMITLDPDTAQANPEVLKQVARFHEGNAGIYAAVVTEGTVRPGDEITLIN